MAAEIGIQLTAAPAPPATWRRVARSVLRRRMSLLGVSLVVVLVAVAIFADLLNVHDPAVMTAGERLQPPGNGFLLGTDKYGRDLLSRIVYGARTSLLVGIVAVVGGGTLGTLLGLISGYTGGRVDSLINRVWDILLSFPSLVLLLVIVGTLGPGLVNGIIAMIIALIPGFGRIARAPVLSEKEKDYVLAATSIGVPNRRVMLRHVLPNSLTPTVVQATLAVPGVILWEASLSFLGLGVQPPTPSWGQMVSEGQSVLEVAPWVSIFPGLAILLAVLGFNLAGDGLRDLMDPHRRGAQD